MGPGPGVRPWLGPGLALGAAAAGVGGWLWSARALTARLLLPGGTLAYATARVPGSLLPALGAGAVGVAVGWLGLGLLASRAGSRPLGPTLRRSASAFLPLALLSLTVLRAWLPLGWLDDPVLVCLDDGRLLLLGGVVLTATVACVRAVAPAGWPRGRGAATPARLVFVGVALVYLACLPHAVRVGPTGDEPDYLLLTHSLVVDRDLDLRNNVARQDYRLFAPKLTPHVREGPGGGLYTAHRPGLPLLLAPVYALSLGAGWPVRLAAVAFASLLAALLAARLTAWARELTGDATSAAAAGCVAALSAPAFFYAYALYPELPAALVVLETLRWIARRDRRRAWAVGVLLAGLPWLHEKFVPLTVLLALAALWAFGAGPRALAGLGLPLALSAVGQAAYYWRLYGAPIPIGVHAGFVPLASAPAGLIGLWLDRDHGLLTLAPVYLLAWAGLRGWLRAARSSAVVAGLAFLSLYVVVGTYREWWGGFAPAPRYLMPLVPVLGVALAFGIRDLRARGRGVRVGLLAAASLAVATAAVLDPALQYRHAHPLRSLLPGVDWTRYLPAWLEPDGRTGPLTVLVLGLAVLVLVVGRAGIARPGGGRLAAAGLLGLGLAAGAVLVGDRVSGATGPALDQAEANRELRTLLLALETRPAARLEVRPPAPPDGIRLVYAAGRLSGRGSLAPDPVAESGEARVGDRAGQDLVFGPYETLPRGDYRASFRLRAEAGPGARVAVLGVTAGRGRVSLAAREVRGEEMSPDGYREVSLDFRLEARTPDLEWRVRSEQAGVRIERVVVIPLGLGSPRAAGPGGAAASPG